MKKNRMMRLASGLMVAVLLTTCAISGTFAKYTTQDSAYDSARVAKWGVALQVVGNLYGETYKDTIVADDSAAGAFTVQSKNADTDVVAPGTKNEDGFTFSLTGVPEVSGEVTATIIYENVYLNAGKYGVMVPVPDNTINAANYNEFSNLYVKSGDDFVASSSYSAVKYYTLEDYVELNTNYYPVEYAMFGTGTPATSYNTTYAEDLTIDTLAVLSATIGSHFGSTVTTNSVEDGRTSKTFSGAKFIPNEDLQTVVNLGAQEINWKWDFCQQGEGVNECADGNGACDACKADTILGNLQTNTTAALKGTVVKLVGDKYVAPVAAAGTNANDYNLESYFSIDITVTQVD